MIPKILIGEIQTEARELFTRILEDDQTVICYATGDAENMIRQIQRVCFSLILLDIQMAFHNGFRFLKTVKSLSPDTPIVVLGYLNELNLLKKALKLAASGYILKPVTVKEFRRKVRDHLPAIAYPGHDSSIGNQGSIAVV